MSALSKYQFGEPDLDSDTGMIEVTHPSAYGAPIGSITWNRDPNWSKPAGYITGLMVNRGHQRLGVATELFRRARAADPAVRHADPDDLTEPGAKFVSGLRAKGM